MTLVLVAVAVNVRTAPPRIQGGKVDCVWGHNLQRNPAACTVAHIWGWIMASLRAKIAMPVQGGRCGLLRDLSRPGARSHSPGRMRGRVALPHFSHACQIANVVKQTKVGEREGLQKGKEIKGREKENRTKLMHCWKPTLLINWVIKVSVKQVRVVGIDHNSGHLLDQAIKALPSLRILLSRKPPELLDHTVIYLLRLSCSLNSAPLLQQRFEMGFHKVARASG